MYSGRYSAANKAGQQNRQHLCPLEGPFGSLTQKTHPWVRFLLRVNVIQDGLPAAMVIDV